MSKTSTIVGPDVLGKVFHARLMYRMKKDGFGDVEATYAIEGMVEYLDACGRGEKNPPSPFVDACWHAAILHTKAYAEFCQKRYGCFLHHEPTWPIENAAATCDYECGPEE